ETITGTDLFITPRVASNSLTDFYLPDCQVGHVDQVLELLVFDVSRFIPPFQLLEEEERNELRTVLISDPVSRVRVIHLVHVEVVLTEIQRFRDGLDDEQVVERSRRRR